VLDQLRGAALLGILLVNIELMRGPGLWEALAGQASAPEGADRVTSFLVGWLAAGKFVSSFALLFGVGAAMLVARAERHGLPPGRLLARRYALLAVLGMAHALLLFAGDILLLYAVTGSVLLAFVAQQPRTLTRTGLAIVGVIAVVAAAFAGVGALIPTTLTGGTTGVDDPATAWIESFFAGRAEATTAAFTTGGPLEVLAARAVEALVVQTAQAVVLPWLLGLFLLGMAATRSGLVADLAGHRPLLRRLAVVGLGVGLPLNLPLGLAGPLGLATGTGDAAPSPLLAAATAFAELGGAPLLAVGYLAGHALLALRFGTWHPLVAVGRMALTAYLTQSLVAAIVFVGFGTYGAWTATSALAVVAGTWVLLLVACPLWLRWFRFGPVEWAWRAWTYRERPAMRR
jgi:uncharacterized protein